MRCQGSHTVVLADAVDPEKHEDQGEAEDAPDPAVVRVPPGCRPRCHLPLHVLGRGLDRGRWPDHVRTYAVAGDPGSDGSYVFWWGPIGFGAWKVLRAFWDLRRINQDFVPERYQS